MNACKYVKGWDGNTRIEYCASCGDISYGGTKTKCDLALEHLAKYSAAVLAAQQQQESPSRPARTPENTMADITEAELQKILAEQSKYVADAARYRWIKMQSKPGEQYELVCKTSWMHWDKFIDSAIEQLKDNQ